MRTVAAAASASGSSAIVSSTLALPEAAGWTSACIKRDSQRPSYRFAQCIH